MKTFIVLIVGIIIVGGAYYLWQRGGNNDGMAGMSAEDMANMQTPGTGSSSMLAEENAVMVSDQRPGTTVTGTVVLASPGYLVIHEDNAGQPGAALGASALLQAGQNSGLKVTLSRAMKEGETLHAMLHTDDGDRVFSAALDTLVQSRLGGPIHGTFEVSANASPEPVSM